MRVEADLWGDRWRIEETRPTTLGWDVLLERPGSRAGPGRPAVVVTAKLAVYLDSHRHDPAAVLAALPIGRTALGRLRRLTPAEALAVIEVVERFWARPELPTDVGLAKTGARVADGGGEGT